MARFVVPSRDTKGKHTAEIRRGSDRITLQAVSVLTKGSLMFTKMVKVSSSAIAMAAILCGMGLTPASAATHSTALQPLPTCSIVTSTVSGHHLDGSVDPTVSFVVQGAVCTQTSLGAPLPTSAHRQSSGRPERSPFHILNSFSRSTHPRCSLSTGRRVQPAGSTAPGSLPCDQSQGAIAFGDSGNSYCPVQNPNGPTLYSSCAHGYMRFHYRLIQTGSDGYVDVNTGCQSGDASVNPSGICEPRAQVSAPSDQTLAYTSVIWNWTDNATEYLDSYDCQ